MNIVPKYSVQNLEDELRKFPQLEIAPEHYFAPGLYGRQIMIPKGTILTGRRHLQGHINVISQGDITIVTDEGSQRIKGPFVLVSKPGTKRAGYAHEDTWWMTIHATAETDLDRLEIELLEPEKLLCHG